MGLRYGSNNSSRPSPESSWKRFRLIGAMAGLIILLMVVVSISRELVGSNDAGYYQIKQAAVSGKLEVIDAPGAYARLFANVTTYHISDMYYFSKNNLDGGTGSDADPVNVQFTDGGKAEISGSIKFRLPPSPDKRLLIHRDFKTFSALKHDLVRQTVAEALLQTASLMKAEEIYTTRRGEFTSLVEDQVKTGIYETMTQVVTRSVDGNDVVERINVIKRDEAGHPVIRKESPFKTYGVEVIQFSIKDIDFDKTIDALIGKKKETEQQKVVAIAAAEKAKQDSITAREMGNARIAEEKANQEVEKIKAVTIAQKEFEVSQLRRKQAEQDSLAAITRGKADAEVNALKVKAGLTPLERANIAKDQAIGVAHELSGLKFPEMMVIGGGNGTQGALDPFQAVGLKSFIDINNKLNSRSKSDKE